MKKSKKTVRQVFSYSRVSSLGQVQKGQSLETQEAANRAYAFDEGLVDDVNQVIPFADRGTSAWKTKTDKRLGWSRMMECANRGDIIIATRIDRLWRSIADAAVTIELLKSKGVDLYVIDRGCVTGASSSDGLTFNILASVASFESDLKSSRVKEVKSFMAENCMFLGGRRTRGFRPEVIGNKKYNVPNQLDKVLLLKIADLKKKRDKEMLGSGFSRVSPSSPYTLQNVRKSIIEYARKSQSTTNHSDAAEKLFSITTLHHLLSDDAEINVFARLEKIKQVEKKIKLIDGKYVLAKDRAGTSQSEGNVFGERQSSLLSIGLRSKQKVDKPIKTRMVRKSVG
jgi:DNA invertase Pin-like site-specific DNA recombinase